MGQDAVQLLTMSRKLPGIIITVFIRVLLNSSPFVASFFFPLSYSKFQSWIIGKIYKVKHLHYNITLLLNNKIEEPT